MNEKQASREYARESWLGALPLLFFSIVSGLFAVVMSPDVGVVWAGLGFAICLLTGWAALVLLMSASKVVAAQKAEEIDALFRDPPTLTPDEQPTLIETEEQSTSVSLASMMGVIAIVLFCLLQICVRYVNRKNRPAQNVNPPEAREPLRLFGDQMSDTENEAARIAYLQGAVIFTGFGKKHVTALDCSKAKIDDRILGQLCRDLPELRILDMRNTWVTDAGLQQLTSLIHLRRLRLGGTSVSPEQVLDLQHTLPECVIDMDLEVDCSLLPGLCDK